MSSRLGGFCATAHVHHLDPPFHPGTSGAVAKLASAPTPQSTIASDGYSFINTREYEKYTDNDVDSLKTTSDVQKNYQESGTFLERLSAGSVIETPLPIEPLDLRMQRVKVVSAFLPECLTVADFEALTTNNAHTTKDGSIAIKFPDAMMSSLFGLGDLKHVEGPAGVLIGIDIVEQVNTLPIDVAIQVVSSSSLGEVSWLKNDFLSGGIEESNAAVHPFVLCANSGYVNFEQAQSGALAIWHAGKRIQTPYFRRYSVVNLTELKDKLVKEHTKDGMVEVAVEDQPVVSDIVKYFMYTEFSDMLQTIRDAGNQNVNPSDYLVVDKVSGRTHISMPAEVVTARLDYIANHLVNKSKTILNCSKFRVLFTPAKPGKTWADVVAFNKRYVKRDLDSDDNAGATHLQLGVKLRITIARLHQERRRFIDDVDGSE